MLPDGLTALEELGPSSKRHTELNTHPSPSLRPPAAVTLSQAGRQVRHSSSTTRQHPPGWQSEIDLQNPHRWISGDRPKERLRSLGFQVRPSNTTSRRSAGCWLSPLALPCRRCPGLIGRPRPPGNPPSTFIRRTATTASASRLSSLRLSRPFRLSPFDFSRSQARGCTGICLVRPPVRRLPAASGSC